jgi:hypothetical protein
VTTVLVILYVMVLPAMVWLAYRIGFSRGERAEFKNLYSGLSGLSIGGQARIVDDGSLDPEGDLTASVVFERDRH